MDELETLPEGASPEQETPQAEPPVEKDTDETAQAEEVAVPQADGSTGESPAPAEPDPLVPAVSMDELMAPDDVPADAPEPVSMEDTQLRAVLEAIVYVAEEPLTLAQISAALQQPLERVKSLLGELVAEFEKPEHGVTVREVAGGYKMATKPEHHEAVRSFVKSLKPPLKLSLPALETLAVIAYKQPVTSPEIMEIRGVRGAGVLNTLLDRKLIAAAGRKNVIGKPILYKTTKEFLLQFGLKDLAELPSLKEFEEIRRMAFADSELVEEPVNEATHVVEAPVVEAVPAPEAPAAEPKVPASEQVAAESEAQAPEPEQET